MRWWNDGRAWQTPTGEMDLDLRFVANRMKAGFHIGSSSAMSLSDVRAPRGRHKISVKRVRTELPNLALVCAFLINT